MADTWGRCKKCGGSGTILVVDEKSGSLDPTLTDCPSCYIGYDGNAIDYLENDLRWEHEEEAERLSSVHGNR